MKVAPFPRPALPPRLALLIAAGAFALAGCVTEQQVRSIVDDSNYQMLLASAPGLETGLPPNPPKDQPVAADAVARLAAFLDTHQDDPALTAALRLRQTLFYLSQRAFALADGTAKQIDPAALPSARDQALAAAYPDLRWWAEYSFTGELAFATTQKDAALRHIAALEQQAASPKLAGAPDLRDYFLEMRAWIGLKLGLASAMDPAFARETVQKAVDAWTATFSAEDLALLKSGDFQSVQPFDLSTRRVIRARTLLAALAGVMASQRRTGPTPPDFVFSQPEVTAYYATLPH